MRNYNHILRDGDDRDSTNVFLNSITMNRSLRRMQGYVGPIVREFH